MESRGLSQALKKPRGAIMRPAWSWEAPDTLGPGRGQGGTEPRGQEKTPEGGAAGPAACKPVPTWESVPLGPPECSPGPCRVPLPPTRTGAWHTGPAVALPPFGEASASNCHPRRRKLSWGDEEGWAWWPGGLASSPCAARACQARRGPPAGTRCAATWPAGPHCMRWPRGELGRARWGGTQG